MAGKKAVGQIPPGWHRQGLQVPSDVAERFKDQAGSAGVGGIKALGTAALAIITEMPADIRFALMRKAAQDTWPEPEAFNSRDLWLMFVALLLADLAERSDMTKAAKDQITWYIDTIHDPELTPEPGRKSSDRREKDRKEGRA